MRSSLDPMDNPLDEQPNPRRTPGNRRARAMVAARILGAVFLLAGILALFAAIPTPTLGQARQWAADLGPWFPVAFFCVYAGGSVFPIPRSTFTYTAAVLFTPLTAIPLCLGATAIGATLAFTGVRRIGYRRTEHWRRHPRLAGINMHLHRRGWLAVLSLRMVPPVPFSLLNYAAALSSIRFRPFLVATVIGSAPGTCAAIVFGDALASGRHGWGLVATGCIAVLGLFGLVLDARLPTGAAESAATR